MIIRNICAPWSRLFINGLLGAKFTVPYAIACVMLGLGFLPDAHAADRSSSGSISGNHQSSYLYAGFLVPSFSMNIDRKPTDEDSSVATVTYGPDLPLAFTVAGSLYGLELGTSFDIPGTADSSIDAQSKEKVKTKFASYSAGYFLDHVGASATWTSLRGMNVQSITGASMDDMIADGSAYRSDIKLVDEGADLWLEPLGYNLSLRDFFDPASPSRGSGIGLMVIGSYDLLSATANQGLIPSKYRAPFGDDQAIVGGKFQSAAVQIGPAATLDLWGVYISGLTTYGSGSQKINYTLENGGGGYSTSRTSEKMNVYLAAGYKGDHVFTCIESSLETPVYTLNTLTMSTDRSMVDWMGFVFNQASSDRLLVPS